MKTDVLRDVVVILLLAAILTPLIMMWRAHDQRIQAEEQSAHFFAAPLSPELQPGYAPPPPQ